MEQVLPGSHHSRQREHLITGDFSSVLAAFFAAGPPVVMGDLPFVLAASFPFLSVHAFLCSFHARRCKT